MIKNGNKSIYEVHNPSMGIKNSTDGISLIALIVTIIVLLILAGISIGMLTGENGVIKNARKCQRAN